MNIDYFDTNTFFINIYHKIQIHFFQNIFYLIIKENRKYALNIPALQYLIILRLVVGPYFHEFPTNLYKIYIVCYDLYKNHLWQKKVHYILKTQNACNKYMLVLY